MNTFAKTLSTAALAAGIFFTGATAATADKWVKIRNQTSVILYSFRASPSSSNSWGPDRLVSKQVPSGYTTTINLNDAGKGCVFDFRAEFKDGDVLERRGVDVCGGEIITYTD